MIICKFNILEFKRGDEQGSQKQFQRTSLFENLSFCLAYENGQNKAKIRRPDSFTRASILENRSFCLAYENGQKKAQTAAPIYFHA